ncbi:MAG: shikimate kinase [Acidobacteriota bacterium]|nr:shikimate kinase [Acidobacteriota bacterium]MDQ7088647.1 shikimate kinase [Acidobacteriota bacterium]
MIPDRVFVFGYVGSRADQVARVLAERLERPVFSTEKVIEASARMPVAEVYRKEGENGFRQRERRALVSVATGPPGVILLGAGTFLDRGNRKTIHQAGVSVFIDASLEECLAGAIENGVLRADDEANERFTSQFELRREEYEKADVLVEQLDRDAEAIADEVLQRLEDRVWEEKFA